jgi:hypothetical protein
VDVQHPPRAPLLRSGASSTGDSQEGGEVGKTLRTPFEYKQFTSSADH